MTASVSLDGDGDMPTYWLDDAFDADASGFIRLEGDLWSRIAAGKRRDG